MLSFLLLHVVSVTLVSSICLPANMSISQYCWLMLIQHFDTIFEMVCDIYCEYFTPWRIFSSFFCLKAKHQYYMYVCDCILYFFFVLTFKRIIYIKLTTPPLLAVYFFLAAKVYQLLIILLFNLVVEIQLWIDHK